MIGLRDRHTAQPQETQVNRAILAIATLLAAPTLFASAAEACISCEYVPEVVRGSQTSDAPDHYARERSYTAYVREPSYTAERERRDPPARRIVRSEPTEKVETADTAPIRKQANNENSSIADAAEVAATETAKVELKASQSENSSIALASIEATAPAKASVAKTMKEAVAKPVDCKKFFPTVGMTLTVPCE
jgi:hypothetical protein